jgi:general stress protein 26
MTGDDQLSQNNLHDKVFSLIKDIRVAQLVTTSADGRLRARPMVAQQQTYNGDLWFFTPMASEKVDDIQADAEVILTYSDPSNQNYVGISGHAEVLKDRSKIQELWTEPMRTWFPKGPDDPNLALLKVSVHEADYWDAPSGAVVHAYGYVKAVVTGQAPNPGDSGHLDFEKHQAQAEGRPPVEQADSTSDAKGKRALDNDLNVALENSFPASDPPAVVSSNRSN